MNFADAMSVMVINTDLNIVAAQQCRQVDIACASKTNDRNAAVMGGVNCLDQIAWIGPEAEDNQYILCLAQRFQLSAENFTDTVIMADSSNCRAIAVQANYR